MSAPQLLPSPLYKGGVNTWECDQNGHLNVRFQCERAMTGLAFLAHAMGMRRAFAADAGAVLVPLDLHIRFLREAHPHAALEMRGGVLGLDKHEARLCLDMRHADGAPATTFTFRVAHAEPKLLKPFPWSSRTRTSAKALACKLPEHAKPRSIELAQAPGEATLARAQQFGAMRIGAHLVTPDQCDAFGRLRAEHVFGRTSDSVPHLFTAWRKQAEAAGAPDTLSGAVVEARIVFRRWPRVGDIIELHSALVEAQPRFSRIVHWLLDPVSGAAWASLEVVALTFDLATRKAVELSPMLLEIRRKRVVAGMGI